MLFIKNGIVPDFESGKMKKKNLLIDEGRISAVLSPCEKVSGKTIAEEIDAKGYVVSPGFIDVHSHGDLSYMLSAAKNPKLNQGVTSEIVGNCGLSVVPVKESQAETWKKRYSSIWGFPDSDWRWKTTSDYCKITDKSKTRLKTLVGYSTIRYFVSGFGSGALSKSQFKKAGKLIRNEILGGAVGVSFGIGYSPNIYARSEEYIQVLQIAKEHGKIVTVHMRNEGDRLLSALKEIAGYNKKIKCPVHISHLKSFGKRNWKKNNRLLKLIETTNQDFDLSFDVYPYSVGSTTLQALLPPDLLTLSNSKLIRSLLTKKTRDHVRRSINSGVPGWENYAKTVGYDKIYPSGMISEQFKELEGKSLAGIAFHQKKTVTDVICDIVITENNRVAMLMNAMDEKNVVRIMKHPLSLIGSDGLYNKKPHPRTYGNFPRFLGKYCRREKIMTILEGLKKITLDAARRFNLQNIGEIKAGNIADIVIFDPETIIDCATYEDPFRFPAGIKYVISGGRIMIKKS